jgi:biopolymer transport protein ExbD
MLNKKERKGSASISAGSMADIAFLLLIFFLVATTIDVDKGIKVKLPPYVEIDEKLIITERNIFKVLVNSNDELLVEGKQERINQLRERTKEFILNPSGNPTLSESPQSALVALQNDRGTSYEAYLSVYNELRAAYNEIHNEIAKQRFGKSFKDLEYEKQKSIRNDFPLVISEAEPTEFGEEI